MYIPNPLPLLPIPVVGRIGGGTGVAISPDFAITAKHVGVYAGSVFYQRGYPDRRVVNTYPLQGNPDVMVFSVDQPFDAFLVVPPLHVWPELKSLYDDGTLVELTGWGVTSLANGNWGGEQLERRGTNRIVNTFPRSIFMAFDYPEAFIPTPGRQPTDNEAHPCLHDSGGAVQAGMALIGVISNAAKPANLNGASSAAWSLQPLTKEIYSIIGPTMDLNADGKIDFRDVQVFLKVFLKQDIAADFNSDGKVTPKDLFDFIQAVQSTTKSTGTPAQP